MNPRDLVRAWVDAFNRTDVDALAAFYTDDAVNHQVAEAPLQGRAAIRQMFVSGFASAKMVCVIENIFEEGEWAILEWRDPLGLRGCGFFHVVNDQIDFQRGYWDKLSFLKSHGLPLPTTQPVADLSELIRGMEPELNPGTFIFATLSPDQRIQMEEVVALVHESEGVSVVVEEEKAARMGLKVAMRCAWITLTVNSDLLAVGLTAAFASALGRAGISCNVVAGTNHDHIFVPAHQASMAMNELRALQKGA